MIIGGTEGGLWLFPISQNYWVNNMFSPIRAGQNWSCVPNESLVQSCIIPHRVCLHKKCIIGFLAKAVHILFTSLFGAAMYSMTLQGASN